MFRSFERSPHEVPTYRKGCYARAKDHDVRILRGEGAAFAKDRDGPNADHTASMTAFVASLE